MRRRRSETISAENFDEYLRLSQLPTSTSRARARNSLPEPFLLSQAFIQNALNIPLETCKSSKIHKEKAKVATSTSYWDDMDFTAEEVGTPATTTCSSVSIHKGSIEEDEFDELETPVNHAKVMVVGAKHTGRHQLVNSFFGLPSQEGNEMATSLDLIVNKITDGNTSHLYKFWIKDALCQKFKHLFRVYHKSVSLFVFVYQVGDKASFECLSQAIADIQKEVGPEEFKGILIGGCASNMDQNKRQVSSEEAEEMRVKYGLSVACEMDFTHNQEYQDHLQTLLRH